MRHSSSSLYFTSGLRHLAVLLAIFVTFGCGSSGGSGDTDGDKDDEPGVNCYQPCLDTCAKIDECELDELADVELMDLCEIACQNPPDELKQLPSSYLGCSSDGTCGDFLSCLQENGNSSFSCSWDAVDGDDVDGDIADGDADGDTDGDMDGDIDLDDDKLIDGDDDDDLIEGEEEEEVPNEPPVVDLDGEADDPEGDIHFAATFTEGGGPVLIVDDENLTVSDADHLDLAFATVTISNLLNADDEVLAADTGDTGLEANYDADNGVLTIMGGEDRAFVTLAEIQTVLRTVTYNNQSVMPDPIPRLVQFVVNDGFDDSETAVSTVTINEVNSLPLANNDGPYPVDEDLTLVVEAIEGVLANDSDVDDLTLTAVLVDDVEHGDLTLNDDGGFSYTPDENFNGSDSFTYKAHDGEAASAEAATVTITVNPINDAPIAVDDPDYEVDEDTTLTVILEEGLLLNDSDPDQDMIQAETVTLPEHGDLLLNADGSFSYEPDENYNGSDSFTYRASDGELYSEPATVSINILAVNDAPVAEDDPDYITNEEEELLVDAANGVLDNDSDVDDGDQLTAVEVSGPVDGFNEPTGTLVLEADGSFSYDPPLNFTGPITFTYKAVDDSGDENDESDPATVTIMVTEENDAPIISEIDDQNIDEDDSTGPLAFTVEDPDNLFGELNISAEVVAGDAADQSSLTLSCDDGSCSIEVTPLPDMNGTVTVRIEADDQVSGKIVAFEEFDVVVDPVNDAPEIEDMPNRGTVINTPKVIEFTVSDIDTELATLELSAKSDNTAIVDNTEAALELEALAPEPGQDPWVARWRLTITPVQWAEGQTTITVTVNDGEFEADDDFELTVADASNAPIISTIDDFVGPSAIDEDSQTGPIDFTVTDTDTNPANLTVSVKSLTTDVVPDEAANLVLTSVSIIGSTAYFTLNVIPAPDAHGTATIEITAQDLVNDVTESFLVEVRSINDDPVALDDPDYQTPEDSELIVNTLNGLLQNDSDPDNNDNDQADDELIAVLVQGPEDAESNPTGELDLNEDGSFSYVPADDFFGTVTFTYKVSDQVGDTKALSNEATVTIEVTPVNDRPEVTPPSAQLIDEDATMGPLTFNITDLETDPANLNVIAISSDQNVVMDEAILIGLGQTDDERTITLTPNQDANTGDPASPITISIIVTDNGDPGLDSEEFTGDFLLTITPINDAPVANAHEYSTTEDFNLNVPAPGVLFNDEDAEDDNLSAELVTDVNPDHGALTFNSNGSFLFEPVLDFDETATFEYRAFDGEKYSGNATITIVMIPVNDPPEIEAPLNQDVDEDNTLGPISFEVGDTDDPDASLIVTATSSNQTVVPDGNISIEIGIIDVIRKITIVPADDQNTGDPAAPITITLTVEDIAGLTAVDTFLLTVNPINDPPVATGESYNTDEDVDLEVPSPGIFGVLHNDSDIDNLTLEAEIVTNVDPAHGLVTLNPDGSFLYEPAQDFDQATSFTYKAYDGEFYSNTVTVDITLNPINDPPVVTAPENQQTDEDVALGPIVFDIYDVDDDNATLTVEATSSDQGIVLDVDIVMADGPSDDERTITITPVENANTGDPATPITITISVEDDENLSNEDDFELTVNPVNDPPSPEDDEYYWFGNTVLDYDSVVGNYPLLGEDLLDNDDDLDGDDVQVVAEVKQTDQGGTIEFYADGGFNYIPPAGFTGDDTVDYTCQDIDGGSQPEPKPGETDATITFHISQMVWYVRAIADPIKASGNGTMADPFSTLAQAEAVAGDGDTIYIFESIILPDLPKAPDFGPQTPLVADITLPDNARLLGQGVDLTLSMDELGGEVLLVSAGSSPSIVGDVAIAAITLGDNNTIAGLNIIGGPMFGILGEQVNGTLNIDLVDIAGCGESAILIDNNIPEEKFALKTKAIGSTLDINVSNSNLGSTDPGFSNGSGIEIYNNNAPLTLENVVINGVTGPALYIEGMLGDLTMIGTSSISMAGGFAFYFQDVDGTFDLSNVPINVNDTVNLAYGSDIISSNGSFTFGDLNFANSSDWGLSVASTTATIELNSLTLANISGYGINLTGLDGDFTATNGGSITNTNSAAVSVDGGSPIVSLLGLDITQNAGNLLYVNNTTDGEIDLTGGTLSATDSGNAIWVEGNSNATVSVENATINNDTGANLRVGFSSGMYSFTNITMNNPAQALWVYGDDALSPDVTFTGEANQTSEYHVIYIENNGAGGTLNVTGTGVGVNGTGTSGFYFGNNKLNVNFSNATLNAPAPYGLQFSNNPSGTYSFSNVDLTNVVGPKVSATSMVLVDGGAPLITFDANSTCSSNNHTGNFFDFLNFTGTFTFPGLAGAEGGQGISVDASDAEITFNLLGVGSSTAHGLKITNSDGIYTFAGGIDSAAGPAIHVDGNAPVVDFTGQIYNNADWLTYVGNTTGGSVSVVGNIINTRGPSNPIVDSGGKGVFVEDAAGDFTLDDAVIDSSTMYGFRVGGSTGTYTFNNVSVTNMTGATWPILVNNGAPTVIWDGQSTASITANGMVNTFILVDGLTGGSLTFSNPALIQSTNGTGVSVLLSTFTSITLPDVQLQNVGNALVVTNSTALMTFNNWSVDGTSLNAIHIANGDPELTFTGEINTYPAYLLYINGTGASPMSFTGIGNGLQQATPKKGPAGPLGINIINDAGSLVIDNATIWNSDGYGLQVSGGSSDGTYTFSNMDIDGALSGTISMSSVAKPVSFSGDVTQTYNSDMLYVNALAASGSIDFTGTYTCDGCSNGLNIQSSDGPITHENLDVQSATGNGLQVVNSSSTIGLTSAQITGALGGAVLVDGATPKLTYNGSASNSSEHLIQVQNTSDTTDIDFLTGPYNASGGKGVMVDTSTLTMDLTNLFLGSVSDIGIQLKDSSGSIGVDNANISSAAGNDFELTGNTNLDFTYSGYVDGTSGYLIYAVNNNGGNIDISTPAPTNKPPTNIYHNGGDGVRISSSTFDSFLLHDATIMNATSYGVYILNSEGVYNFDDVDVSASINSGFTVQGGTATIEYDGSITGAGAGYLIDVNAVVETTIDFLTGPFQATGGIGGGLRVLDSVTMVNLADFEASNISGIGVLCAGNEDSGIDIQSASINNTMGDDIVLTNNTDTDFNFAGSINDYSEYLLNMSGHDGGTVSIVGSLYKSIPTKFIVIPKGISITNSTVDSFTITDENPVKAYTLGNVTGNGVLLQNSDGTYNFNNIDAYGGDADQFLIVGGAPDATFTGCLFTGYNGNGFMADTVEGGSILFDGLGATYDAAFGFMGANRILGNLTIRNVTMTDGGGFACMAGFVGVDNAFDPSTVLENVMADGCDVGYYDSESAELLSISDSAFNNGSAGFMSDTASTRASFDGVGMDANGYGAVFLSSVDGTFTFTESVAKGVNTITGSVINSIVVTGGNPTLTYNGSISQTTGDNIIELSGTTGSAPITINGTGAGIVADGSLGIYAANNTAPISIDNADILNTAAGDGVTFDTQSGDVVLTNLEVDNNSGYGMLFTTSSGSTDVSNAIVTDNGLDGIRINGNSGTMTFDTLTVTGNAHGIYIQNSTGSISFVEAAPGKTGAGIRVAENALDQFKLNGGSPTVDFLGELVGTTNTGYLFNIDGLGSSGSVTLIGSGTDELRNDGTDGGVLNDVSGDVIVQNLTLNDSLGVGLNIMRQVGKTVSLGSYDFTNVTIDGSVAAAVSIDDYDASDPDAITFTTLAIGETTANQAGFTVSDSSGDISVTDATILDSTTTGISLNASSSELTFSNVTVSGNDGISFEVYEGGPTVDFTGDIIHDAAGVFSLSSVDTTAGSLFFNGTVAKASGTTFSDNGGSGLYFSNNETDLSLFFDSASVLNSTSHSVDINGTSSATYNFGTLSLTDSAGTDAVFNVDLADGGPSITMGGDITHNTTGAAHTVYINNVTAAGQIDFNGSIQGLAASEGVFISECDCDLTFGDLLLGDGTDPLSDAYSIELLNSLGTISFSSLGLENDTASGIYAEDCADLHFYNGGTMNSIDVEGNAFTLIRTDDDFAIEVDDLVITAVNGYGVTGSMAGTAVAADTDMAVVNFHDNTFPVVGMSGVNLQVEDYVELDFDFDTNILPTIASDGIEIYHIENAKASIQISNNIFGADGATKALGSLGGNGTILDFTDNSSIDGTLLFTGNQVWDAVENGFLLSVEGPDVGTAIVSDNTFTDVDGQAIDVFADGSGGLDGTISTNYIENAALKGIRLTLLGSSSSNFLVTDNTGPAGITSSELNFGASTYDTAHLCLEFTGNSGNNVAGVHEDPGSDFDVYRFAFMDIDNDFFNIIRTPAWGDFDNSTEHCIGVAR